MGHVEYIEKLIEEELKDFARCPASEYDNPEDVENFRRGMIYGMRYIVVALKNPIDFEEEGDNEHGRNQTI